MTFPTKLTDNLYTSKEGKLNSYSGIDQLDTLGKYDLFRLDKVSDNGIALTLCTITTTQHTSKVSKAALEKGTSAVVTEQGLPLVFGLNINSKDRDGKDNPDYLLAKQLLIVLDYHKVKTGEVYFAKLDMSSIAPKSTEKLVKMIAEDEFKFISVNEVDFSDMGQSEELWAAAIEKITGEKFVEGKTYAPKATKDEIFKANIKAVQAIALEDLIQAYECNGGDSITDKQDFDMFCDNVRMSILLNF